MNLMNTTQYRLADCQVSDIWHVAEVSCYVRLSLTMRKPRIAANMKDTWVVASFQHMPAGQWVMGAGYGCSHNTVLPVAAASAAAGR
jgi:hypothetical protein